MSAAAGGASSERYRYAARDGEADPLYYVRDELTARGQLPPRHLHPVELLAQAAAVREDRR